MTDTTMTDAWETLSASDALSPAEFFEQHELQAFAEQLIEVTGADTVKDLALLDDACVTQLVNQLKLKMVAAQKLRAAIASLRPTAKTDAAAPPEAKPDALAPPEASSSSSSAPADELREAVVVCIDRSGSMGTPLAEKTINEVAFESRAPVMQRTRMEAVKAMFYAFRDATETVGGGTHKLALLSFDNEVETRLGLTSRLADFEAIVDDIERRGQTAIFSSVVEAAAMLAPVFEASPQTDLRIIVLTDGQNNTGAPPQAALAAAQRIGAVVDALIVGDRPDRDLRRLVTATGGQAFQINDLGSGFELLENAGVASLKARRGGGPKPPFVAPPPGSTLESFEEQSFAARPARAAPQLAAGRVLEVSIGVPLPGALPASSDATPGTVRRLMKEMASVAAADGRAWLHTGEGCHLFPSQENVLEWRALVEGPADSPFAGGTFALSVRVPQNYPLSPPTLRFVTPVYHCNVSDGGDICLDILKEKWNPALSVPKAVEAVRLMLRNPDTDNALRQWIAELTLAHRATGDARYVDEAKMRTAAAASKTVKEWKAEWSA